MNRFKLFDGSEFEDYGFIIQLKDHPYEGATYWWIPDLYCGKFCDIPDDCLGWADSGEVGKFIGYITFKEFNHE